MKKNISFFLFLIFFSISSWGTHSHVSSWSSGNYDNCILKNMKGVGSDLAAKVIMDICLSKYKDLPITICVEIDSLVYNNNIYLKDTNTPFSGNNYCEYPNGVIKSKGKINDGKKDGRWTWYSEKGNIGLEKNYKNGLKDGRIVEWYKSTGGNNQIPLDGQLLREEFYKSDKKEGKWKRWHAYGQIIYEVNYKDDKRYGKLKSWYDNGQIQLEENYKDGKKEGQSTTWYPDGQIQLEENYKEDKKDDQSITWYPDGQIQLKENYKDGKKEGQSITWYQNGQKSKDEIYKDGKKDGKSTWWNLIGQIMEEKTYKDGVCISGDC